MDSITENFYMNLERNISIINSVKEIINGTHSLDMEKAEQWIEMQVSQRRKTACRNLIKHTRYVTFEETLDLIQTIVLKILESIDGSETVYLYTGSDRKKSNYFISVIACDILIKNGCPRPIIIEQIDSEILRQVLGNPLLIFDDMSYSGKQMSELTKKIFMTSLLEDLSVNNVHIGLVGCTDCAIQKIKTVNMFRGDRIKIAKQLECDIREIPLFYKLGYQIEAGFIQSSLDNVLEIDEFIDLLYYFSPYTDSTPKVSIYFDHKIADDISTFYKPLLYGPVIPTGFNYDEDIFDDLMFNSIKGMSAKIDSVYGANSSSGYISGYIMDIVHEESKLESSPFYFHPFMNGIPTIDMTEFQKLQYSHFHLVNSVFHMIQINEIDDKCHLFEIADLVLSLYNGEIPKSFTWYKNDETMML